MRLPYLFPDALLAMIAAANDTLSRSATAYPDGLTGALLKWVAGGGALAVSVILWRFMVKPVLADLAMQLEDLRQERRDERQYQSWVRLQAKYEVHIRTVMFAKDIADRKQQAIDVAESLRLAREAFAMAEMASNSAAAAHTFLEASTTAHSEQLSLMMKLMTSVNDGVDALRRQLSPSPSPHLP